MIKSTLYTIPFFVFIYPRYASAYSWQFTSQPSQCQNVSIAIQGSGQPPYSFLLIPNGPSILPNKTEVRTIQNIPFTGTSLSFTLNYPEGSSFVAVVSDSSGFGTGGTSIPITVLPSSDSSCYDPTKSVRHAFVFYVEPTGGITQCESARWWWGRDTVDGNVNFYGVIPGGDSFNIPQGPLSTNAVTGTGFSWTVDITGGTNFLIVGNDDRGIGSGGVAGFTVAPSTNSSCLSSSSPSSTAGSPAGGSFPTSSSPTSTSGSSSGGSSGGRSNTGAIAGGIAGGLVLVAVALIAFFYFRRRRYSSASVRPINVLHDDEDYQVVPRYNPPESPPVLDLTNGGTSGAASTHDRPPSMTTADIPRPQTLAGMTPATTTTRKTPRVELRFVNIVQHDDAGPSEAPPSIGEPETIELPPAYTNIRSAQRPPSTAPVPTTAFTSAPQR
ncbi:hypothetical protein BJY52DRAFT_420513 [Lactarius psammicola]|nr:hypothetical protein BJY52DRAFT_420513 [Lactarius psammicola]